MLKDERREQKIEIRERKERKRGSNLYRESDTDATKCPTKVTREARKKKQKKRKGRREGEIKNNSENSLKQKNKK